MICPQCLGIGLDEKYEVGRNPTDYDGAVRCMRCLGSGEIPDDHDGNPRLVTPQEWRDARGPVAQDSEDSCITDTPSPHR